MSSRGSFTTEYIDCRECFSVVKKIIRGKGKFLCSTSIPGWGELKELPIIAGKIGGLWDGEEVFTLDVDLRGDIEKHICHPIRIAILADNKNHDTILEFKPK